jgi:tRNA A-37 threonylcarbamoyl transferase component Bud32
MRVAEPGDLLAGRYRLRGVIGRGGMGTVWRGRDELLHRDVAVKEIRWPPQLDAAELDTLRQRALREARTAARLNHPNIVTMYDVVQEDGRPWIVMQLVPYRSLTDAIGADGPLPPDQVAQLGLRVLAALVCAHESGVLHRDVKPGNVLLGPGSQVVLTDFGMAIADGSPTLTTSGILIGSPSYLAPERARGATATPAADLWSLGATLYAAVEGRPPFDRNTTIAVLTAVVSDDPDPPHRAGPLWPVITGLLRKDPGARLGPAEVQRLLSRVAADGAAAPGPLPDEPTSPLGEAGRTEEAPVAAGDAGLRQPPDSAPPPEPVAAPAPPAASRQEPLPAAHDEPPSVRQDEPVAMPGDQPPVGRDEPVAVPRGEPMAVGLANPVAVRQDEPVPGSRTETWMGGHGGQGTAAGSAGTDPARSKWRLAAAVAAAAIALAAAIAASVSLTSGGTQDRRAATPAASKASAARPTARPGTVPSLRPSAKVSPPPASGPGTLPAGFVWYHDPNGFSIGVPGSWHVSHQGHVVYVRDPASGRFLLIDQSSQPKPDPLADWRRQEANRVGTYPGYHRIRLAAVHYAQAQRAADWEFTYYQAGQLTHVLNRNILANATHAYALYWSTPAGQWAASLHLFQTFAASFRPAAA